MSILDKHLQFVNDQVVFQQKMAEKFSDNPFRQKLHTTTKEKFEALAKDLEMADKMLDKAPDTINEQQSSVVRLSITPDDIEGLPDELLDELSGGGDRTEFTILNIIEESGGLISLDKLIIALYRSTGEIHKRQSLTSRLYRMAQNKLVFNVAGKKGVYSNRLLSEKELKTLLQGETQVSD